MVSASEISTPFRKPKHQQRLTVLLLWSYKKVKKAHNKATANGLKPLNIKPKFTENHLQIYFFLMKKKEYHHHNIKNCIYQTYN